MSALPPITRRSDGRWVPLLVGMVLGGGGVTIARKLWPADDAEVHLPVSSLGTGKTERPTWSDTFMSLNLVAELLRDQLKGSAGGAGLDATAARFIWAFADTEERRSRVIRRGGVELLLSFLRRSSVDVNTVVAAMARLVGDGQTDTSAQALARLCTHLDGGMLRQIASSTDATTAAKLLQHVAHRYRRGEPGRTTRTTMPDTAADNLDSSVGPLLMALPSPPPLSDASRAADIVHLSAVVTREAAVAADAGAPEEEERRALVTELAFHMLRESLVVPPSDDSGVAEATATAAPSLGSADADADAPAAVHKSLVQVLEWLCAGANDDGLERMPNRNEVQAAASACVWQLARTAELARGTSDGEDVAAASVAAAARLALGDAATALAPVLVRWGTAFADRKALDRAVESTVDTTWPHDAVVCGASLLALAAAARACVQLQACVAETHAPALLLLQAELLRDAQEEDARGSPPDGTKRERYDRWLESLECATAEAAAVLSQGPSTAEGTTPAAGFQVTVPELVPEIDFDPDNLRPLNDPEAEVLAKPTWLRLGLAWSQSAHDDVQRSASRLLSNMACGSQGDLVAQCWLLNIIKDCTDTLPHEHKVEITKLLARASSDVASSTLARMGRMPVIRLLASDMDLQHHALRALAVACLDSSVHESVVHQGTLSMLSYFAQSDSIRVVRHVARSVANLAATASTVAEMMRVDGDALDLVVQALNLWMGDTDARLRSYARRALLNLVANGYVPTSRLRRYHAWSHELMRHDTAAAKGAAASAGSRSSESEAVYGDYLNPLYVPGTSWSLRRLGLSTRDGGPVPPNAPPPDAQVPDVDVVFVHGLRGGPLRTWRMQDGLAWQTPTTVSARVRVAEAQLRLADANGNSDDEGNSGSISDGSGVTGEQHAAAGAEVSREMMGIAQVDKASTGGTFRDRGVGEKDDAEDVADAVLTPPPPAPVEGTGKWTPVKLPVEPLPDETDADRRIIWPIHWLPSDLASMGISPRIISVHYEAAIFEKSHPRRTLALEKRAQEVRQQLRAARVGEDRPAVFITHSLGGLLVKSMICEEEEEKEDGVAPFTSAAQHLAACTDGILFYATPHRGSPIANYGARVARLLGISPVVVRLRENDEVLLKLNDAFCKLVNERNSGEADPLLVLSVTEGTPAPIAVGIEMIVVPEVSANVGVGMHTVFSDSHHINLCKPRSQDDERYTAALQLIARVARTRSFRRQGDHSHRLSE